MTLKQRIVPVSETIRSIVSSKDFFYFVLFLAVMQGLWYAFSFIPSLFDEPKHLGRIDIYTQQFSPFLSNQKPEWDQFGQMTRDSYHFFYYLMSWPLRFIRAITDNQTAHIIFLRILNILAFGVGLIYYRRALILTKRIPAYIANLSLLFVVITPTIAILPGAINYDNFIFMLFAALLLFSVRILNKMKSTLHDILKMLSVGLLMVIVKWTSIALFIPTILIVLWNVYKKYNRSFERVLRSYSKQVFKGSSIVLILLITCLVGLMTERHLINQIKYGKAEPACNKILTHERCMEFHDYAVYEGVRENKPHDFNPVGISEYTTVYWYPRMVNTLVTVLPWNAVKLTDALPVISEIFFVSALLIIIFLSIHMKKLFTDQAIRMFVLVTVSFIFTLIVFLYVGYKKNGVPAATHGRYLLPVLPIILSLSGVSLVFHLRRFKTSLIVALPVIFILLTQGGSITTHSLTAQDRLYWNNQNVKGVNDKLQKVISPFVDEE